MPEVMSEIPTTMRNNHSMSPLAIYLVVYLNVTGFWQYIKRTKRGTTMADIWRQTPVRDAISRLKTEIDYAYSLVIDSYEAKLKDRADMLVYWRQRAIEAEKRLEPEEGDK